MSKPRSKSIAPIVCAVVIITVVMATIGVLAFASAVAWMESAVLGVLCGVYALLYAAIVVGVVFALRERLREIRGGEEDDASQY